MSKGDNLGDFEQLVLLAVARLGRSAYGTTIRQELEKRAGRATAIGALYAALDRLERKNLVTSSVGEPTAERGGRARRYFALTERGAEALQAAREAQNRMWTGLRLRPEKP